MNKVITRAAYMAGKHSFDEYYGQFVTKDLITYISAAIGTDRIKNSQDPHFNDIPLAQWDRLTAVSHCINHDKLRGAENHSDHSTYPRSLCTQVCMAKAAARAIKAAA